MRGVGAITCMAVLGLVACTQSGPSTGIREGQQGLESTGHPPWVTAYRDVYSATHWDSTVEVRCNSVAAALYKANSRLLTAEDEARALGHPLPSYTTYPVGSVVLKVHRRPDQGANAPVTMWTGMQKISNGSDATKSEWLYQEWDADGRIVLSGNADTPEVMTRCSYCHIAVQHRDFLYHHASSGPTP